MEPAKLSYIHKLHLHFILGIKVVLEAGEFL